MSRTFYAAGTFVPAHFFDGSVVDQVTIKWMRDVVVIETDDERHVYPASEDDKKRPCIVIDPLGKRADGSLRGTKMTTLHADLAPAEPVGDA